jgi:hypothetical protein
MNDCKNTMSTCPNVPIGAEILHDEYLKCGDCTRECEADKMLTGTCTGAAGSTKCETCTGSCRMDMEFSVDLYMAAADLDVAKKALFFQGINVSLGVPLTAITLVSVTESNAVHVNSKYITVTSKIALSKDGTLTSMKPHFTASSLKTQLISNGFTAKANVSSPLPVFTFLTDKGTMLAVSQPKHTKTEGIIEGNSTEVVAMIVQLPLTAAKFDEAAQVMSCSHHASFCGLFSYDVHFYAPSVNFPHPTAFVDMYCLFVRVS